MKKVYLETFGCQMNVSDTERVASQLESDGFEITRDEAAADVVLFNTCSVREKAEHKLYTRVGRVRNSAGEKPLVGILGCVAQLEGETLFAKIEGVDFVLGTKAVGRISKVVNKVFNGEEFVSDLGDREENYNWSVSHTQQHSPYVSFVPIIEGCNKFCTYCIVPFSRGREKSISADLIVSEVLRLKKNGVKEIHLIGQNVNSYRPSNDLGMEKFKGATPFSRLLRAVAATGIDRIKFTTSFPRDFHDDIVDAINEFDNLCDWVHLPVQSGSNRILKAMRRGHTIESYFKKIDKLKSSKRNISLTTDIIIGFPGETEEDFSDTVKMYEYCGFDTAYVFKYSPRPGTPAFEMSDDVSTFEKTRRFLELEKVQKVFLKKSLDECVGKNLKVLVEKKSVKNPNELSGHSTCHKVVNFSGNDELLGQIVNVKITKSKSNTLSGEII